MRPVGVAPDTALAFPAARVRRVRPRARPGDPSLRPINTPLTRNEQRIAEIYRRAVRRLEEGADWGEVIRALRGGHIAGIVSAFPWEGFRNDLGPSEDLIRLELGAQGEATAATLRFAFTLASPRAISWASDRSARLVVEITENTRQAVTNLIHEAFTEGRSPFMTARALRDVVGLNSRLAGAVAKLRSGLEAAGARNVDAVVARKSAQLLRYRTELIARTEILTASNQGKLEAWRQAREQGLLPPRVGKVWIAAGDGSTCAECESLDGEAAPLDQSFSDGQDGPPDHPDCRCTIIVEAGSLD